MRLRTCVEYSTKSAHSIGGKKRRRAYSISARCSSSGGGGQRSPVVAAALRYLAGLLHRISGVELVVARALLLRRALLVGRDVLPFRTCAALYAAVEAAVSIILQVDTRSALAVAFVVDEPRGAVESSQACTRKRSASVSVSTSVGH